MKLSVINTEEIKHIRYEEWVVQAEIPDEPCEDCNGTGEVDCPRCGQSMDCETCGGTGKTVNAKLLYEQQKEQDNKKLQKWVKAVTP